MRSSGNLPGLCNFMRPFNGLKTQGMNERALEALASKRYENGLK